MTKSVRCRSWSGTKARHAELQMPNLGPAELLIVFALVMVLFGANRLPKFARSMGEAQRELRQAQRELRQGLTEGTEETGTPA